jgi:hypothetical protein
MQGIVMRQRNETMQQGSEETTIRQDDETTR